MKFLVLTVLGLVLSAPCGAQDARVRYFGQEHLAPTFTETLKMFSGQFRPLSVTPRLSVIPGYTPEDRSGFRETVFAASGLDQKVYQVGYARVSREDCRAQRGELEILATPQEARPRQFTMPFDLSKSRPRDQLARFICGSFPSP